jgi:glutamate racemase
MNSNNQPIGFDSGIMELPFGLRFINCCQMKTIYLADSKNAPYGQKSKKKLSH